MTVIRPIDTTNGSIKGGHVGKMLQKRWGSTHRIKVYRKPNTSLGISIVGGKVDLKSEHSSSEKVLGIFVKNVVSDSPAGKTGQFKTGDRILEVSGVDLRLESHEAAVNAIRNAENPVTFVIQSIIPWTCENNVTEKFNESLCSSPDTPPLFDVSLSQNNTFNYEENQTIVEINNTAQGTTCEPQRNRHIERFEENEKERETKNESSENSDDDDEEDVRNLEGRTFTEQGQQIDRASAGNFSRTKEEILADSEHEDEFGYTTNKVKKKYAGLGHTVLMVQIERSSQGLGLSLAGHKDRNCMAVFVCGLNPKGSAFKTADIHIGDEILEVNGVVLHGRCHLNASAIIKGLSGPIFKVILLRRKTAVDDIAVKPITQFPVSLAEEATEEQFSAIYPNVRTVSVKKGNQSLGIMIIEGRHAEVGQGIFISDIQDGSFAEKAGLEIGEMILAVNKDSLVGSNYDTAANLLKRTEGLVTLVVSNPAKKEPPSPTTHNNLTTVSQTVALKSSGTPSRPSTPIPDVFLEPTTCPIIPGKECIIELQTDNKGLGIFFIGGKDTFLPNGIAVIEIYAGGAADKDNRLKPGDQIIDVNGTSLKDTSYITASQALRQTLPKMKLTVYRPENIEYTTVDVDLVKKPGKGFGLSVVANKSGKGVYIADIINGGIADVDGRIMKGDLLISVNEQNVDDLPGDQAGVILKTKVGKVNLKLHRHKLTAR